MIYVILNVLIAAFLIRLSFNVNAKNLKNENALINIILVAVAMAVSMVVVSLMVKFHQRQIAVIFEHLSLLGLSVFYIMISIYFITSAFNSTLALTVAEAILMIFATYVSIGKISVEDFLNMSFSSNAIFSGEFGKVFPITWGQFYVLFFCVILPMLSLLTMMLFAENVGSRLLMQRSMFFLATLVIGWVGMCGLSFAVHEISRIVLLFMLVLAVMSEVFVFASVQYKVYDALSLFSQFCINVIKFALPAIVGGIAFVFLRPIFYENDAFLYYASVFFASVVAVFGANALARYFSKISAFRSTKYGAHFEADLAVIDYDDETADICQKFYGIFQNRAAVDEMRILINSGNNELNTVFSSDGIKMTLSTKDAGLEAIRAEGINVFLREDIQSSVALEQNEAEINTLMKNLQAECLIILNEGRHLMGILVLGKKRGGSSYDEYDKEVFDKLYSYFFVFGYYMSNIANASVVGTVNREIKMSAQIIKSIQENMDFIKNPKIDVGYLMVPAHNIGGEFVDLIRLNEKQHIFVVGAMSGKGISASMNMVILKSIIRTLLASTRDFKKLVAKVNEFIRFSLPKGTFFAGVFCMIDFETDTMYYINCGIPAMLLYTRSFNNVIEIQGAGFVLGFAKNITPLLKVKQIKLNPGDVMAITTAGVINSHSLRGDQYGKDSIKKSITDNYMYDGMHMAEFLFDDLKRFMAKELDEDITVMMIRYLDKNIQTVTNFDE